MFGVPVYVAQCFMTMCVSALALVTLCVFMKVTGRSNKMLFPPLIIMLLVTGTALAERTIGLVKAIAAGSATFLVEGLQLIIAILLIILGLTIVINSLKAYFASRKNSEKHNYLVSSEIFKSPGGCRPGDLYVDRFRKTGVY